MELYCKQCNYKITVSPLVEATLDQLNMKDGEILIAAGKFIESEQTDVHFDEKIDYLMNPKGLRVMYHKDTSRLTGCCGPGPFNGLNLICGKCNAEIGIINEDCIMPHFIGISMNAVSKTPVW